MSKCKSRARAAHAAAVSDIVAQTIVNVLAAIPLGGIAVALAIARGVAARAAANDRYQHALDRCDYVSPLILDLNGDGVEAGGVAYFDHGGDGFAEASRWADEDDGVLVWDRNGDGVINDGSELFGNNTYIGADGDTKAAHGFAALADLDSNADGVVDENDNNFADLRVMRWTDANDNGIKESGEERLETLSAVGVQSLNTSFVNSDKVDESGNEHRQVGSFTKTDGTTAEMTDVWFVTAQDITTYDRSDIPAHSESIAALPDIAGQGRMYDLRDAMALDAVGKLKPAFYGEGRTETRTLEELVSAFAAADMVGDKVGREALVEKILLRWAGAEGAVSRDYWSGYSFHYTTTPQKLAVVEVFMGHQWRAGESYRHPAPSTAKKINSIYQLHYEQLYARLMLQTHLKDLNDAVEISLKEGTTEGSTTDIADYKMDLSGVKTILDGENNARHDEFFQVVAIVYGDVDMIMDAMTEISAAWAYNYSYITDYIYGNSEIAWVGAESGHVRINSADIDETVKIAPNVSSENLLLSRNQNDLVVVWKNADGVASSSLTVTGYYSNHANTLERVEFVDGTKWGSEELLSARDRGTAHGDTLYGLQNSADAFDSDAGGNDRLRGYSGDDVYWLGVGTGNDVIQEYDSNTGDAGDEIRLKSGIGESDVRLSRGKNGNHLYVELLGADGAVSDSLQVYNYYTDDSAKVEKVVFVDGAEWDVDDFALARIRGSVNGEDLKGKSTLSDVFDSDAGGNDRLRGYSGDDVYWLGVGTGNDVIHEYDSNTGDAGDEIRLKLEIGESDVRLSRGKNGNHLYVELLGADGAVSDSLQVYNYYTDDSAKVEKVVFVDGAEWDVDDFALARIRGGVNGEDLKGKSALSDVFDSDAGGNDGLYGYGGNDVYYLGAGTGNDVIHEYDSNTGDAGDEIRLKLEIGESDVRLSRDKNGSHLYVELLGADGAVSDSLQVYNYYTDDSAKVEKVVFVDGAEWDVDDFALARIRGGVNGEDLKGKSTLSDVFDSDAGGNDGLYGYGGNDVYYLGAGTGNDVIHEYDSNTGDAGDEIRLKLEIGESDVRLSRDKNGSHLYVELLGADGAVSDSLQVYNYYTDDSAKVEKVVFVDGAEWDVDDFALARIRGGVNGEDLKGKSTLSDVFDSDAGGNDGLYGYGGNDVYYLGAGTGNDVIHEYDSNTGDAGDEIRLKLEIGESDVRLSRGKNGDHLYVQLLNGDDVVSDSLRVHNYYTDDSAKVEKVVFVDGAEWDVDDFALARIRGGVNGEDLKGKSALSDVFDSDAGGNDGLYGYGGNDVYYLGVGTGNDVIHEYSSNTGDAGDEIRLKLEIGESDVRLSRGKNGNHLYVELLGADGAVSDSLQVYNYYTDDSAKVEKVVFADGAEWDVDDFALVRIRGGVNGEDLKGKSGLSDVFDSDAGGNDYLYGYSGDDVYYLGVGTGHDVIWDYTSGTGDAGDDEIRIKSGISESDVRLSRIGNGNHLSVQLLGADGTVSDSLRVHNYYRDESAKVESIHANGKVLLSTQYQALIDEMSVFDAGNSQFSDLDALLGTYWQDEVPLSSGG